jgi:cell division protein FtsA
LTGGGAQLKHIKQLVEYITGMDTRIGYPNEHLAGNSDEEMSSPLYATAVGLVMNSIKTIQKVLFENVEKWSSSKEPKKLIFRRRTKSRRIEKEAPKATEQKNRNLQK